MDKTIILLLVSLAGFSYFGLRYYNKYNKLIEHIGRKHKGFFKALNKKKTNMPGYSGNISELTMKIMKNDDSLPHDSFLDGEYKRYRVIYTMFQAFLFAM